MSSLPQPTRFQIISWNILNDFDSTRYPLQRARLSDITAALKTTLRRDVPAVVYLCEGSQVGHLQTIARDCGLVIVGAPFPYTPTDWMVFAVSPELAEAASMDFVPFQKHTSKFGALALRLGSQTIVGAHYPWRPLRDTWARNRATADVLAHLGGAGPRVVLGDLNSMAWMTARRRLAASGLSEVHEDNRPSFPHEAFRGISFPRVAPSVSIDAMYTSHHYRASNTHHAHHEPSDHPLISAVLELGS